MRATHTTWLSRQQVADVSMPRLQLTNAKIADQKAGYLTKVNRHLDTRDELVDLAERLRTAANEGTLLDQETVDLGAKHEPSLANQWEWNTAKAARRAAG